MNTKPAEHGILVSEEKIESAQQSLSSFFRERGKELQERLHVGENPWYPQEEVAKNLNISVAQLRNKIYRKKPLTRDWLIAICAAYGLDWQETSDALRICNMPGLDTNNEASTREKFIKNFLDEHSYQPVSVFIFNRALEAAKLPPLEISFRNAKGKTATTKSISPMYRETRPRVIRTYANEGDRYNSLSTQYLPNMRCVAAAFLEDLDQKNTC